MAAYDTLLFPSDKFHEIGPFRFPIYEDLVPGEAKALTHLTNVLAEESLKLMDLAQRIATDKSLEFEYIMELMQNPQNAEYTKVLGPYMRELHQFKGEQDQTQHLQEVALVMLNYRGQVLNPETKEYESTADWRFEHTDTVPLKLLKAISSFVEWERDGWPEQSGPEGNETPTPEITEEPMEKAPRRRGIG
jgi:hypothetical protein